MKLEIIGDISAFYIQTLCLLFYPGSKFSDKEKCPDDGLKVLVSLKETGDTYYSSVKISDNGKVFSGEYTFDRSIKLSRPSMAKKITVGKAFLHAGKLATGIVPPWGLLTGVRPSKLALWNIDQGMTEEESSRSMQDEYALRRDKADLACAVASAEKSIIKPELYDKCSLYIAIPFCPSRCSYCSFVSFTSPKLLSLIPDYIDALVFDIKKTALLIKNLGLSLSTVYIGGGTPTVLNTQQMSKVLSAVYDSFDLSSLEEYTLEGGRPDTITTEKMVSAKNYGVTRVSVNTQTLNNEILSKIGRHHTADDFFRAYNIAYSSGIDNINVDLIAGLPDESFESFSDSVERVSALSPENITVHTFCVKKSADIRQSSPYAARSDTAEKSIAFSQKSLISKGYVPYYMYRQKNAVSNLENVGYSKPGHEGLYNILMMEEVQSIFAVGASSVTKLVRYDNNDSKIIIKRLAENKYPYEYLKYRNSVDNNLIFERDNEIIRFFSDSDSIAKHL